jgi:two-component system, cell cycle sensor histidine kinase and response regulator CckA
MVKRTHTILVVDDDRIVLEFIEILLEDLSYQPLAADNAKTGLELYKKHQAEIDLVLLDIMMPGTNGIELFKAIQQLNPRVKCFLVSGYTDLEELEGLKKEGLLGIIRKPFSSATLAQKLEDALSQS